MIYKWDGKRMSTGVDSIDQQHRELFDSINRLHQAMSEKKGEEEAVQVLEFLKSYVANHFGHEETIMAKHSCPIYTKNKEAHEQFTARFQKMYDQCKAQGMDARLLVDLQHFLGDWLTSHICWVDTELRLCVRPTKGQ